MARLEVDIVGNLDNLDKGLNQATSRLQSFASKAQSIGIGLTAAITLPIIAIGNASLRAASEAEETFSKFDVVFRDVAKSAESSFQSLRTEYGLSGLAAKQLLSDTGDLLTGFGFSQEAALDLATSVNTLAVDLASFTNFSGGAEGASQALTKALLGERESVKALGISILEEDVKKQVAINTAKGLTFETERQAKAYATLDIAISQSKNAIGDYARTSDGFANQQRLLQARIEDLSVSIGSIFLPIANRMTGVFLSITESLNGLSENTKTTIVVIAGIAAAIGPLLLGIGTAIKLIPILTAGFAAVKVAMLSITGPIGLAVLGIAALAYAIVTNWESIKETLDSSGITQVFTELAGNVKELALLFYGKLSEGFKEATNRVYNFLDAIKPLTDYIGDQLIKQVVFLGEVFSQTFGFITDLITGNFSSAILRLETIFLSVFKRIVEVFKPILELLGIGDKLGSVLDKVDKKIADNKAVFAKNDAIKELAKNSEIAAESIDKIVVTSDKAKQTLEEFSKIADIKNEEVFRKWTEEADNFNKELAETLRLQKGIEDISVGISAGLDKPIQDLGIDLGDTAPIVEIPDFDDSKATAFIQRLTEFKDQVKDILEVGIENTIGDFAFSIGEALGSGGNVIKSAGAALLGGIAAIMNQLGQLAIGAGIAIGGIKKALMTLNPVVAIGAGVALIALAGFVSSKAKSLGGSISSGGGGGGNISTGAASQNFGGVGVGFNNQQMDYRFVLEGTTLVATLDTTRDRFAKG